MREGVELFGSGTKLRDVDVGMNQTGWDEREKERTLFEETSVTIYEQDHGYTFFVSIIGQL